VSIRVDQEWKCGCNSDWLHYIHQHHICSTTLYGFDGVFLTFIKTPVVNIIGYHRVEFQNKFYKADGIQYIAFSYE